MVEKSNSTEVSYEAMVSMAPTLSNKTTMSNKTKVSAGGKMSNNTKVYAGVMLQFQKTNNEEDDNIDVVIIIYPNNMDLRSIPHTKFAKENTGVPAKEYNKVVNRVFNMAD